MQCMISTPSASNFRSIRDRSLLGSLFTVLFLMAAMSVSAQTSEFSYQGQLQSAGVPANGNFDFDFKLFDSVSGGSQLGSSQTRSNTAVGNGIFSVTLDFGSNFPGAQRFLEIYVRPAGMGTFTLLTPRQPVTSSPYSIRSLNSASADSIVGVLGASSGGTGVGPALPPAGTFLRSNGAGWQPAGISSADIPGGSTSYIQNGAGQQASSSFNISGNGTAGGLLSGQNVNASFEYRLLGQPFLSAVGTNSRFGIETGSPNSGIGNTYAGYQAGSAATSNSSNNTFFGNGSGKLNSAGSSNAFFGGQSGESNTSGGSNAFFGISAGASNTTGGANTMIGAFTNVSSGNLSFATAVGAGTSVSTSNTIVLGRFLETVQIPGTLTVSGAITGNITNANNAINAQQLGGSAADQYVKTFDPRLSDSRAPLPGSSNYIQNGSALQTSSDFNVSGTGTASIFNAGTQYSIAGNRVLSVAGTDNVFAGGSAGFQCTSCSQTTAVGKNAGFTAVTGVNNSFFGFNAGASSVNGANTFLGSQAAQLNTTGTFNTAIGYNTNVGTAFTNSTAIGAGTTVSQSNSVVLGNGANVGIGTSAPKTKLHVAGGSIYIASPNSLVITSPNGSCFFITVNDGGGLSTIPVACP